MKLGCGCEVHGMVVIATRNMLKVVGRQCGLCSGRDWLAGRIQCNGDGLFWAIGRIRKWEGVSIKIWGVPTSPPLTKMLLLQNP